jgi:hypothetical protein
MGQYAANTEVSQEKSRMEIETTLRRYGADAFSYGWESARAIISFRASGRIIRFEIGMPDPAEERFTKYQSRGHWYARTETAAKDLWEKACRQRWRALALVVKAKLEAVESGISEFEHEFLAHIVLPDGSTVGNQIAPYIEKAYESGTMPKFLALTAGATTE